MPEQKYKEEELKGFLQAESPVHPDAHKNYLNETNYPEFLDELCPFFYVFIDFHTLNYQLVSGSIKRITGYDREEFLKHGVKFIMKLYHPDVAVTQKAIHQEVRNFLLSVPSRERTKYSFSYDLRIKKKDGKYIKLLQRNKILEFDEKGNPLLMLGICTDITDYKVDNSQTLLISKLERGKEVVKLKKDFYPEFENGILTRKEVEIWQLVSKGIASKKIAEILDISIHTVGTHRKRILKKLRLKK
jgi:PAS domain S-box-containing protein